VGVGGFVWAPVFPSPPTAGSSSIDPTPDILAPIRLDKDRPFF
jgi:hypothetical protein